MEVTKIREKQEQDKTEMEAKDDIIAEQRDQLRDMDQQLNTKTMEIKVLIDRMEAFSKHKDAEITKVR